MGLKKLMTRRAAFQSVIDALINIAPAYLLEFDMAQNPKFATQTGARGPYWWLTASEQDMGSLLATCPRLVMDKYLAVTSFDSGPLALSEEEIAAGWRGCNGIAYSPKVLSVEKLPHELYDEWYVFQSPAELGQAWKDDLTEAPSRSGHVAIFVNYGGFGLFSSPANSLIDLFWRQLVEIQPESFIANGDLLNFVTRDKDLFAAVFANLK